MRVVFMGSPDFAIPTLQRLLASAHAVQAVVTVPDKPAGRGKKMTASPVKLAAQRAGLPVLQPLSLTDPAFIAALQGFGAEVFIVVAFRILPPEVFTLPVRGAINLHASLLPSYRGAAPINWALLNGESRTGVTTFLIEKQVDTGRLLLQKEIAIPDDMIAGELYQTLAVLGADLLLETLDGLESGRLQARPQSGVATAAPKINKEMGCIDWTQPTARIYNLYRGLSPIPGVYSYRQNRLFKFQRMRPASGPIQGDPGSVVEIQPGAGFTIATGDGALQILQLQPEGRRSLTADEFLRGYPLAPGDRFQSSVS
ncbi:methionyl-tRNA formyltransferase [bacterium]|nr:methionyl-tRNA formyltransferase [bacterium]